jgi:hypothetical protein
LDGRSAGSGFRFAERARATHRLRRQGSNLPYRRRSAALTTLLVLLAESLVLSLGVFKSLNTAGVRTDDWSLVASFEGTF